MSPCVRINPQVGASLGFDLTELVAVVGDQSHLEWEITDLSVLAPRPPSGELWTFRPEDTVVTWPALVTLAQSWLQVIDGVFTGRLQSGSAALVMRAVDSSFWTVSAQDPTVIDRIRDTFDHVVDVASGVALAEQICRDALASSSPRRAHDGGCGTGGM